MQMNSELLKLEEEVFRTGSAELVAKAFELMKFERLVLFLEDVLNFAPPGSAARELVERLLPHIHEVRQILYSQEV